MNSESHGFKTFYDGFRSCLPTVLGYLGIGIAAGVVGKGVGLSVPEIMLMSIFIYAGSAQFIICGMLAMHAPVAAIVVTTFLVNFRHFLMSMSVAAHFNEASILSTVGIGTLLTDESYGVLVTALSNEKKVTVPWVNGLNITAYLSWITATALGGLLGGVLPDPEKLGMDFALTAMFLGLFVLQAGMPMKKKTRQTLLMIAVVCASLFFLMKLVSAELAVIFSTLLGCLFGVVTQDE